MKDFNLTSAKDGAKVCTKEGKSVRLLAFDRESASFPIVGLIENRKVCCYTIDGKYYADKDSDNDLRMV